MGLRFRCQHAATDRHHKLAAALALMLAVWYGKQLLDRLAQGPPESHTDALLVLFVSKGACDGVSSICCTTAGRALAGLWALQALGAEGMLCFPQKHCMLALPVFGALMALLLSLCQPLGL
jgi:hypothetical protein